ncbi:MAG: PVC-type heme-binding CxxCH protein [Pirellulales bacterium]
MTKTTMRFLTFTLLLLASTAHANDQLGLRAPPGFEITLYADDHLASDIYSLTVDSLGRVVVSGRNYVRILLDTDADGIADSAKLFVNGPKSGAQGMTFVGRDLLCSGDQGLLRYSDCNADDRADGPPELLLAAKAGGEHNLHAIRQGPDGYFYLMAGNQSDITAQYATLPSSPVKNPLAGTLLRITPDFKDTEILAHGFRNAYDFDFHPLGDLFTYDSDGERDVSLPWYRPTRVFHVLPGSHAGWFSRHWKRPHYFFDMPPVVAAFGRGSPTGVVCYRHHQFPKKYQDALFVLDWTYGRVMALPLTPNGSAWKTEPEKFISAVGQHGFAPTDAAVGPDGSLYISVGGRGTRGGVYRISWQQANLATETSDNLTNCLAAPQPLSSWSRNRWEPLAEQLGEKTLRHAALETGRPTAERIRAVEILTEIFSGLDANTANQLTQDNSSQLRARVAWSLGRTLSNPHSHRLLDKLLQDQHPMVLRQALETLVGQPHSMVDQHAKALSQLLAHDDATIRQTVARATVYSRKSLPSTEKNAHRTRALIASFRREKFSQSRFSTILKLFGNDHSASVNRDAVRAAQMALGNVGPGASVVPVVPVFEGYTSRDGAKANQRIKTLLLDTITPFYPADHKGLNHELGRLIAMIAPNEPQVFNKVLNQITDTSHPVEDIHHLIILARLPVQRTLEQRNKIALAVVSLEAKIETANLNRDSNWDDRISEMVAAQVELDPELPTALLTQPQLGAPGHTPLVQSFEGEQLEHAVDKFIARIHADPDYPISPDVVRLLSRSQRPEVKSLLRNHVDQYAIRSTILSILAADPDTQDRALFVTGLDYDDVGILSELASALQSLPPSTDPTEIVTLVRTLRRLAPTPEQRTLQDALVRLLRSATHQSFGYEFDQPPSNRQAMAINGWTTWAHQNFPDQWAQQVAPPTQTAEQMTKLLAEIDWQAGNPERGKTLFNKRSCGQCHSGRSSLGPDLAGVTARFSRHDLFNAIINPNHDVSPRYQTTLIVTEDGRTHTGRIIYGSVDGLVFRTSTNTTLRINTPQIAEQRYLNTSLMPTGLLNDLPSEDLADLYTFLRTLGSEEPAP